LLWCFFLQSNLFVELGGTTLWKCHSLFFILLEKRGSRLVQIVVSHLSLLPAAPEKCPSTREGGGEPDFVPEGSPNATWAKMRTMLWIGKSWNI